MQESVAIEGGLGGEAEKTYDKCHASSPLGKSLWTPHTAQKPSWMTSHLRSKKMVTIAAMRRSPSLDRMPPQVEPSFLSDPTGPQ